MLVHPEVQRAVQIYHPDLLVKPYEHSTRDENRYCICQRIRGSRRVDERIGLYEEFSYDFPVLWVDQATVVDRRWFEALDENRWDRQPDIRRVVRAESDARKKAISNMNKDWARDVGWWHWKREAEQFSTAGMTLKDSTRRVKERQDKTGRDNLL